MSWIEDRASAALLLFLVPLLAVVGGCPRPAEIGESDQLAFTAAGELIPFHGGSPIFERRGGQVFSDLMPLFKQRDLVLADLSGGLDYGCRPAPGDAARLWEPDWLADIEAANIKILSLADDHALDCGRDALHEGSNQLLSRDFYVVGSGRDQGEARAPVYLTSKGASVSIAGFLLDRPEGAEECESCPGPSLYDRQAVNSALEQMKERSRFQIVLFHLPERDLPALREDELEVIRQAVDFGADLVLCYGPGSGGGLYRVRGRWIVAGMGRLTGDPTLAAGKAADSLLVSVEFTANEMMNLRLAPVALENGAPRQLRGDEGREALEKILANSEQDIFSNANLLGDILYLE